MVTKLNPPLRSNRIPEKVRQDKQLYSFFTDLLNFEYQLWDYVRRLGGVPQILSADSEFGDNEDNGIFNNLGATSLTICTIPATASTGSKFEFQVGQDTNGIKIVAPGRIIVDGSNLSTVGGFIQCIQMGGIARAVIVNDTYIFVSYSRRLWSVG